MFIEQMVKPCGSLNKKCDKWPGHGKLSKPRWVTLVRAFKYGLWRTRCGHLFCWITSHIQCMTKHDYDDLYLKSFVYTLQDLEGYVSNFNKPKEIKAKIPTTTNLYCAKTLFEELKNNVSLDFAKWLYDYS